MARWWIGFSICLVFNSISLGQDGHIHKPIRKARGGIPSRTGAHWDQATVGFPHDISRDHETRRSKINTVNVLSSPPQTLLATTVRSTSTFRFLHRTQAEFMI